MRIIVSVKIVPDDQAVSAASDGSLDFSRAVPTISTYDLNAIEAANQIAAEVEGSSVVAMSVGAKYVDESKVRKNILGRGVDQLYLAADDSLDGLDAYGTAQALAGIVSGLDGYDLIVCGDGSADNYAQQVDVQLAARLGVPCVNGVTSLHAGDGCVVCERTLEDVIETVEVPLPAVVAVAPAIAQPRILGMHDILAAGKKPVTVIDPEETESALQVVEVRASDQVDRECVTEKADADGAIDRFVAAIKAAL